MDKVDNFLVINKELPADAKRFFIKQMVHFFRTSYFSESYVRKHFNSITSRVKGQVVIGTGLPIISNPHLNLRNIYDLPSPIDVQIDIICKCPTVCKCPVKGLKINAGKYFLVRLLTEAEIAIAEKHVAEDTDAGEVVYPW